jgi:hypothetical protein
MPAISISDDQRERLRWIQRRLGDDVEYGHVRPRDALEYLLDRFDEADDEPAASEAVTSGSEPGRESSVEREPGEDPETASTVGNAFGETAGFAVVNGGGVNVVEKNGVAGETTDGTDEDDHDGAGEGEDGTESDDGDAGQADGDTDGAASDEALDGDDGADGDASADADDEARLSSVMSLLDDHDDRWSEASGGEEKYEVDLPDGTTERARTKDDVRALLFQHYR